MDIKLLRLVRLVRLGQLARVLKSLERFKRAQSIATIADTLVACVKHVGNIFLLWLLVSITFALLGMPLFGTLPTDGAGFFPYNAYGPHSNFESFPQALFTLAQVKSPPRYHYKRAVGCHFFLNHQVATLDNWTWLMRDIMHGQRARGQYPTAWIFFITYVVVTSFLILNLFTAVIMDQ